MTKLYITEHGFPAMRQGSMPPVVAMPPIAGQVVAIDVVSAASAAFNANTHIVGLHTDTTCSVKFGAVPVAAPSDRRLVADSTEYFEVNPGDKVAVIVNS